MKYGGCVYIMTNASHTVLYTGVTSDLYSRVYQHKHKLYPLSFTARYYITKLVFFEAHSRIEESICREKQIKAGSRAKKEALINSINPDWNDLFEEVSRW